MRSVKQRAYEYGQSKSHPVRAEKDFLAGFDLALEMLRDETRTFDQCHETDGPEAWADWLEKQRGEK